MLSRYQIFKLLSHSRPQITPNINAPRCLLSTVTELPSSSTANPTTTESPEIPNWVSNQTPGSSSPDEDFVIPSLASWIENLMIDDHSKATSFLSERRNTDVDKVSEVLNNRHQSYDKVVEALNCCRVSVSIDFVEQILKRFSNDWIPAFGFFIWAKSQTGYMHTPELYNTMVDILGKKSKFSLMWDLIKEMNQLKGYVTLATITKVMRRLAKAGKYSDAVQAFRGLEQFGVSRDAVALNVLLDALVKARSVERAFEVFVEFKEQEPQLLNSRSFNILIHGFCNARKLEDARKIMDDMEEHGYHPDVLSYTCFIKAYCQEKDFRKFDAVLEEMQQKGCKPNTVAYTMIMHARGSAGEIDQALEVYEKMKGEGCLPDASFYSALIFILGKAGRLKDADEIFEDMEKQGVKPDLLTYNTMISSACHHSQEEKALKLLKQMEADSCNPNIVTYVPLLKMCCRKKWIKVLNFLLSHMLKNNVSIDMGTYTLLVCRLRQSGKVEMACSFFEEMLMKGMVPKDSTYKRLVKELEAKSMEEAKDRIEKVMSEAKELRSSTQNA